VTAHPAAPRAQDPAVLALADGAIPVCTWLILPYDSRSFPFAALLSRDVFGVGRLEELHEYVRRRKRALGCDDALAMQDNLTLRRLIQDLDDDSPFYRLYRHFMLKVLAPVAGRPLSYSNHPKMRVHLPGTPSVSSFHADVPVTGRIDQLNFWIPFTDVQDTATLWLESCYGRGDYAPVPVRYGEVLIFDGGYLSHGTVSNQTQTTRVSLDMRFCLKGAATRLEGVDLMNILAARLGTGHQPRRNGDRRLR
jgi:hypothetical protein